MHGEFFLVLEDMDGKDICDVSESGGWGIGGGGGNRVEVDACRQLGVAAGLICEILCKPLEPQVFLRLVWPLDCLVKFFLDI